jgi:hypothetical protein
MRKRITDLKDLIIHTIQKLTLKYTTNLLHFEI